MLIYGWGKDLKDVAYAGIEKCPQCKNWSHFYICEHSSHASLYFIRVAKWSKKWVYVCKVCSHGWEVEEGKKDELIRQTVYLPSQEQCLQMWTRYDKAVSEALDRGTDKGQEAVVSLIREAITATLDALKETHQDDHARYVAQRYVAFLQDQDTPK